MNKAAQKQNAFMKSLSGIGDILVFETRRKSKNKLVTEGLGRIKAILEEFFRIREEDEERFERLMLHPDFLKLSQENEREASARLMFFPERQLVSFTVALEQIRRVHETAIVAHNEEISRQATYHLIWILQHLTTFPQNGVFVEQVLRSLYEMSDLAIRNDDHSMYGGAYDWYFETVFRAEFRLEYLETLTGRFRVIVQGIISNDQWELYMSMVQRLVDGVHIGIDKTHRLRDLEHQWIDFETFTSLDKEHHIRGKNDELVKTAGEVSSIEEYQKWLKNLDDLRALLAPHVPTAHAPAKDELLKELESFVAAQLKFNTLQETVFVFGAFALLEERPQYIKYLWEYKQPPDSDAVHVGADIVPTTLENVVAFYFRKGYFERDVFPWKDHRGRRIYFQRYFLLLLARQLEPVVEAEGVYPTLRTFALPWFSIVQLSNIESVTDDLKKQARLLTEDVVLLQALGFSESTIDTTFDRKLPTFLGVLKEKAIARIEKLERSSAIDSKKVAEFKKNVVKSFRQSATMRDILNRFGLYKDRSDEPLPENPPDQHGINQIDDKAAFFRSWHVDYLRWGENYGEGLAAHENTVILNAIIGAGVRRGDRLEEILGEKPDLSQVLLVASPMTIFELFELNEGFVSRWRPDAEPLEIESFQGWFLFNGARMPVFHAHVEAGIIVVADSTRLGRLVQYDPNSADGTKDSRTDILSITVRSFSEDEDFRSRFLENPPPWLTKKGDRAAQERYLQSRVLVRVMERFEFVVAENPSVVLVSATKAQE